MDPSILIAHYRTQYSKAKYTINDKSFPSSFVCYLPLGICCRWTHTKPQPEKAIGSIKEYASALPVLLGLMGWCG